MSCQHCEIGGSDVEVCLDPRCVESRRGEVQRLKRSLYELLAHLPAAGLSRVDQQIAVILHHNPEER